MIYSLQGKTFYRGNGNIKCEKHFFSNKKICKHLGLHESDFFFFSVKKRIRTDSVLKYEFFMSLFKSLFWKETNCRVPSIMAHQKYSMINWSLTQKTKKFIPINRIALLHAERGLQHKNCNEACKNMDDELMKPAGPEPVSRQGEWTSELLRSTRASSRSARQKPLSVFSRRKHQLQDSHHYWPL